MFIINDSLQTEMVASCSSASSRRYFRGRNSAAASAGSWHYPPTLPSDQPDWGEIMQHSTHSAIKAVKQSLIPACFVWGVMAIMAVFYYWVPPASSFFTGLERVQVGLGRLFPFLGMGVSVGLLAEGVRVCSSADKRWTKENTLNAGFNLLVFGTLGMLQAVFYGFQTEWFGSEQDLKTLACKVMMDQFAWTVFFANPYQTILFIWKENNFQLTRVWKCMRPIKTFWGMRVLPVLITNWAFWIPMASIIYSFPSSLQLPLAILAVTIWVIMLTILTSEEIIENQKVD
ncbi:hypothetical protein ACWPKO_14770 [Coraliomargarita sp. W4R53]